MPSDSSGRYQSRLLNFLNRQTMRLTNQIDRTVRHIKVAAVWGVQIILYPVYLLTQVGLSAGRQLSSEAQEGWPRLQEFTDKFSNQDHEDEQGQDTLPEVDTPILQVLREVTSLPLPEIAGSVISQPGLLVPLRKRELDEEADLNQLTTATEVGVTQQPSDHQETISQQRTGEARYVIQGVGCLLATRSLVLVTVENQILDILTPQQQEKLASKISWEVANMMRQRRLVQASKLESATSRLSTLDKPRVLLPVRVFWKVMAWVQTSPIAITANLFQESTLIVGEADSVGQFLLPSSSPNPRPQLPGANEGDILNQVLPPKAIAFLDSVMADWETHQLVPGTEALARLRDRLASSLQHRSQQPETPSISSESQPSATETSQTHPFQIQTLIAAAIDYFFGRRGDNLSGTDTQEQGQIPGNPKAQLQRLSGSRSPSLSPSRPSKNSQLVDGGELDPWLSEDELFGNPDVPESISYKNTFSQGVETQTPNQKSQPQLPDGFGSNIPLKPKKSIWDALKSLVNSKQSRGELAAPRVKKQRVRHFLPYTAKEKFVTTPTAAAFAIPTEEKNSTLTEQTEISSSVEVGSQSTETVLLVNTESTAISTTSTTSNQETNLEPAPDWIETKATPSGYVKHPLEQLLEWLDFTMVRVEDLVLKFWRWLWERER